MRIRIAVIGLTVASVAGFAALSLLRGQERTAPPAAPAPAPPPAAPSAPPQAVRDFSQLNGLQKDMLLSARRGAEWLFRMNQLKGRFVHGLEPSLPDAVLDGDNYLRQAGAAFALARSARVLGDDRYTARASQAILTLLDETALDPKEQVRCTAPPSAVVNRLGAAGLLVLAINELPDPQIDLLDASEQLCNYIRKQGRPDGSLICTDLGPDGKPIGDETGAANEYCGVALYALMRSQLHKPAAWKTDIVRKAVGFYRPWRQAHKSLEFVPWFTSACWEAYQRTKEQPFADFVFEMNDWLCGLQYNQLDAQRQLWLGGFQTWADDKAIDAPPTIASAFYAEGLVDACRTARQAVDLDHYSRYRGALQLDLQFIARLQYSEAGAGHFSDWYRPRLVGGFHASHQDGNLRIDYNQHAVSALVQFLDADLR
ncbi:MAG TPA: hypothetical protein VMS17_24100 [Gemmataceae bacterium]|nr:hypothetical protein [Gemmataceae bacterium]